MAANLVELSVEQREVQRLCCEFAEREIRPVSLAVDAADTDMPWDVWHKAAALGLTSLMLPAQLGGGGMEDAFTQALVQEELCFGCAGIGNLITSNGFFAKPVLVLGNEEQARRWVEPLASERPPLGALASTEPGVGSDAAAITTTAARVDGGYLLSGQKSWVSNAGPADFYVVFATVAPGTRSKGITAFVLEKGDPGFGIGPPIKKMGQRAIVKQFGKPIGEHQAVGFRLADMAVRVDASRLLVWRAARRADAGKDVSLEAAMAKLHASEAAMWCTWAAVQTLGGWGYSREYPVEKWMRDAKLEEIEEGTSDIQRLIISRLLLA